MKEISTSLVRQEVRFIPARMENHRHFQKTYACSNCEKTGTCTPFIKSEVPKLPLNNTAASASLIAMALDRNIYFIYAPNPNGIINIFSLNFEGEEKFDLTDDELDFIPEFWGIISVLL